MASNIGQVSHLEAPPGWLPGDSYKMEVRVTRTRRSFKFLGRRKAINGGNDNALHSRSEVGRINRWRLVVEWKVGGIG